MPIEHFPVRFPDYDAAYGLLSTEEPSAGIVFVHGFGGNPRDTWEDFPGMIEVGRAGEVWKRCDLFFYSYPSYPQIPALADTFLQFLKSVVSQKGSDIANPFDYSLRSIARFDLGIPIDLSRYRGRHPYGRLILVGHSAGAVVIREAMRIYVSSFLTEYESLNEGGNDEQLILTARLRLFAPAHRGVLAAGKLGAASETPGIRMITRLYTASNPLYQNLKPTSDIILDLRRATESLYTKHKFESLRAYSVFGQLEDIVQVADYDHDYQKKIQPDHDHVTICKPNVGYPDPLGFVMTSEIGHSAR